MWMMYGRSPSAKIRLRHSLPATNTKKKLQDLQSEGEVKVTVHEDSGIVFDVGDTVTARDNLTGITVNATISKKIVKVSDGVLSVDYGAE